MYVEIMIPLDGFHAICYYTHITNGIQGYRGCLRGLGIKNLKQRR